MLPSGIPKHIFNVQINPTPESHSSIPNTLCEPHFMEQNDLVQPTTSDNIDKKTTSINSYFFTKQTKHHPCNVGMNAESLSMCTEGLGFESFDDVEQVNDEEDINDDHEGFDHTAEKNVVSEMLCSESKRSRIGGMEFPPPVSSIGLSGKPLICLESYRGDGRFVLKEVRIESRELLHSCREDRWLKLQFIQSSDDEVLYEEDEDDDDDDDDERLKVDP